MAAFPKFWYESNAYFTWVNSLTDLQKVFEAHKDNYSIDWLLDNSMVALHAIDYAKYGLRRECNGDKCLRQFLTENDVRLPVCAGTKTIEEYITEIK